MMDETPVGRLGEAAGRLAFVYVKAGIASHFLADLEELLMLSYDVGYFDGVVDAARSSFDREEIDALQNDLESRLEEASK